MALYNLKSKKTDISPGQYSVVHRFSGELPGPQDVAELINQTILFNKHMKEFEQNPELTSIDATVQW